MTKGELEAFVRGITPTLRDYINTTIDARFKAFGLSAPPDEGRSLSDATVQFHQVDPATLKPHVVHRGQWHPDRIYTDGDGVMCNGLAYRAVSATRGCEPGSDERAWRRL
jgi:hypothetical protein